MLLSSLSLVKQFEGDHSLSGNAHQWVTGKGVPLWVYVCVRHTCVCVAYVCVCHICVCVCVFASLLSTRVMCDPYHMCPLSNLFIQWETYSTCWWQHSYVMFVRESASVRLLTYASASLWTVAMVTMGCGLGSSVTSWYWSVIQETNHVASSFKHTINPLLSQTHDLKLYNSHAEAGDWAGYLQMSRNRIKTEPSLIPQQFSKRFRYCREHKHRHLILVQHE